MTQPACPIPGYQFSSFPTWLKVRHAAETNVKLFYRAPLDGAPRPVIVRRVFKNSKIRIDAGEVCFTADPGHLDRFFWLEKVPVVGHYSYGSGMSGCLYDYGPHFTPHKTDAVDALLNVFQESLETGEPETMRVNLLEKGIHYFQNPSQAGATYCEVSAHVGPCREDS